MTKDSPATGGYGTISVAAILSESATRRPDSTALIIDETRITYADLWAQTRAYAGALQTRGIGPGDPVAVLIPNVPDFVRVYYAILALGAVVVPVHALLKAHEIEFVLSDSGAKALICAAPLLEQGAPAASRAGIDTVTVLAAEGTESLPRLEDEAAAAEPVITYLPRQPEDTATILYTSGTTGRPKGALGSHFALVEQTNVLLTDTFDITGSDVLFGGLPLFHTFGQTAVLNTGLRAGAAIVLLPRFTGAAALSLMSKHAATVFMGVPSMYAALLESAKTSEDRPDALRYGISGGASLPLALLSRFREVFGTEIYEGYGLTETSPVAAFNHVGVPPRPGTIGTPIWGVDVEIARPEVTDRIELMPHGALGELVIRGHLLMKGYLNRPEATAEAIVDGWFRSGDLGTKDEDGYLRILDRKKDMIIRNGNNVYPREVEEVMASHPDVASVAVFGVSHEVYGQEVVAAVILSDGANTSSQEILDFGKDRLAAYKYPRIVQILPELPLGPSGKILKRALQSSWQSDASARSEAVVIGTDA
ncbi:long-chain fatty acid--CoA ligase [Paenarthrobacter nitroguajacolicus]|uniref:Long-chain fatty acid--CoA ligase n=1 Tax=Paenarthrobacter nitroguajacolicus TaxID=211146 RepID=A0A558GNK8_PAENT|nr:long-chain fatty acid--CoA ligase [Paenarthrobacter nitroguajacolicus]TVU58465.1 long-chain fatty acid--CoA ligase [Paenarthrobacter nitroguajacolicus]